MSASQSQHENDPIQARRAFGSVVVVIGVTRKILTDSQAHSLIDQLQVALAHPQTQERAL